MQRGGLSAKRRVYFCKSITIEMGGVSRYFSKASGSGVDSESPENQCCDVVCLLEPLEPQIVSEHLKVTQKSLGGVDPKVTQERLESDSNDPKVTQK